jgi:DNA-binding CsgD family transcriptional regulator
MQSAAPDPISAARLSELIGLIYDCAIDPTRWPVALEAIRIEIGGANASLDLVSVTNGDSLFSVVTNIPSPYADTIRNYVDDTLTMWGGIESLGATPLTEPSSLLRITPHLDALDLPMLVEWARPQGLADVLGIWLARDADTFGFLGFGRLGRDGAYGDREVAIATLLVPHLQRAATINRLFDLAALERSSFAALFDTLAVPILLVAHDLRLVHANASARALLAKADTLFERSGFVGVRDIGTGRALAVAVGQATADGTAIARKGLGIPVRRDGGDIGALHVLPLAHDDKLNRAGSLAAIFVAQSHTPLVAPTEMFAALFGLTPSEGRVFDRLASGHSVAQIADAFGVEDSTVKTHLLRIYDKTGVRRQAELVHLAASMTMPFAGQRLN